MKRTMLTLGATALLLTALVWPHTAGAKVTKFINYGHSLTGDCNSVPPDTVLDPGCPGGEHPPAPFGQAGAVAVGPYGEVYVVNRHVPAGQSEGANDRVEIFDANGHYIKGFALPIIRQLAVDSTGHLYVGIDTTEQFPGGGGQGITRVWRYDPSTYAPQQGEIEYVSDPILVRKNVGGFGSGTLAVDRTNDHLYINYGGSSSILEYGPATDGVPNTLITDQIAADGSFKGGMALDASRHLIYVVEAPGLAQAAQISVYDSRPPYSQLPERTIDGSATPLKKFPSSKMWLAVDEKTGHLFVSDLPNAKRVYEFDEASVYLGVVGNPPNMQADFSTIAIDNSPLSPNRGYLYVPSGLSNAGGHLYAFEPQFIPEPPVVESLSFTGVTEGEAVLRATVNPKGAPTHWSLQYVTQQAFEQEGFANPTVAGEGEVPNGNEGIKVSAPARNLAPGTAYRFRIVLENQCQPGGCVVEEQSAFTTFRPDAQSGSCPNQALRTGASAALPDCRAYELVTPANTGGLQPYAPVTAGSTFGTPPASPNGNSFAFLIGGGTIPGTDGAGGHLQGETYRSTRTPGGWQTISMMPNGEQAYRTFSGGLSAEHDYFAFETFTGGSMHLDTPTTYVRYPDGSFRLAGEGSLGIEPQAEVRYIAPGAAHQLIWTGAVAVIRRQLEPQAPPTGTAAIYDRTPDGVMHVVSLLPGEVTPPAGQQALWVGASKDGAAVAFTLAASGTSQIYLRVDNAETQVAAPDNAQFAGLSDDGRYLFYMLDGDLHRYDSETQATEPITTTGNIDPVNFGGDGSDVYFLSPSILPTGANAAGEEPQAGAFNLYHWSETATTFVGAVNERDAKGFNNGSFFVNGLGLWMEGQGDAPGLLSSRTTPDGSVLLFESRANLTSYEADGKAQIYRYEAGAIECLSCHRTGAASGGDASLIKATELQQGETDITERLVNSYTDIANLTADGARAFFETPERLLAADNDGVTDVYEWEAEGKGTCAQPGGCLFLISSGQSTRPNHLIGVSESGEDVFILTSDLLVAEDTDATPSVYTARVGGGFAPKPPLAGECLGEACQPAVSAPQDRTPASSTYVGAGNVSPEGKQKKARCPKGKRAVRKAAKNGKAAKRRCVPRKKQQRGKHQRKSQQRKTSTERRASR